MQSAWSSLGRHRNWEESGCGTAQADRARPQDAPYLLERMAGEFAGEPAAVRLALLTAAARLFFKRPPECQRLLGAVLAAAAADSNQDVHDRGLMYYRRAGRPVVEQQASPQHASSLHFAAVCMDDP